MEFDVNAENYEAEVVKCHIPVLVDFWGPQCGPCLSLKPKIEDLARKHENKFKLVEIDASKNKRLCLNLRVLGLPTFLIYKNGDEVERLKGNDLKFGDIENAIKKFID